MLTVAWLLMGRVGQPALLASPLPEQRAYVLVGGAKVVPVLVRH